APGVPYAGEPVPLKRTPRVGLIEAVRDDDRGGRAVALETGEKLQAVADIVVMPRPGIAPVVAQRRIVPEQVDVIESHPGAEMADDSLAEVADEFGGEFSHRGGNH